MKEKIIDLYNKIDLSKKDCKEGQFLLTQMGYEIQGGCFCNPTDRISFKIEFDKIVKDNKLNE